MLEVEHLAVGYDRVAVIRDLNLKLEQGKVTCLVGHNGAGKTTSLKAIMGLLLHQKGTIKIGNQQIQDIPAHRRARKGIALVPQGRAIFPKLTVLENLRIGLESTGQIQNEIPSRIFDQFTFLKEHRNRYGGELSGGQQQQLAIARALLMQPRVLLLDEPTEGIQPNIVAAIGELIRDLVESGAGKYGLKQPPAILLVEQKLTFLSSCGDNFYFLESGATDAKLPIQKLFDKDWCRRHLGL
jgi:urea transport system ATP-binding protein